MQFFDGLPEDCFEKNLTLGLFVTYIKTAMLKNEQEKRLRSLLNEPLGTNQFEIPYFIKILDNIQESYKRENIQSRDIKELLKQIAVLGQPNKGNDILELKKLFQKIHF